MPRQKKRLKDLEDILDYLKQDPFYKEVLSICTFNLVKDTKYLGMMNFKDFENRHFVIEINYKTSRRTFKETVLHEFAHVLDCIAGNGKPFSVSSSKMEDAILIENSYVDDIYYSKMEFFAELFVISHGPTFKTMNLIYSYIAMNDLIIKAKENYQALFT